MVNGVEEAVAFYTQRLGFSLEQNFGPIAMVSREGLTLLLSGPNTSVALPMSDGQIPVPGGWNRLVIQVDDLTSLVETLRGEGVHFLNEIIDGGGGRRQTLVEDPAGNKIELFQGPR